MIKNTEWGAAAYLSASIYGAGVDKVQINAAYQRSSGRDPDNQSRPNGITGCGPQANGNLSRYDVSSNFNTCGGNPDRTYTGSLGQLASTTNNVYGIYDMSGGNNDAVMANYNGINEHMINMPPTNSKYINVYPASIFTSDSWDGNYSQCTWVTCGGQALHEILLQTPKYGYESWGSNFSVFVRSGSPWAVRGDASTDGSRAGVFASDSYDGSEKDYSSSRGALVVLPQ